MFPILMEGQDWSCRYYGVDETRISQAMTCIVEDKNGLLWIGTDDAGLAIFDGYSWEYIHRQVDDSIGLASNTIYSLHYDSHGNRILVGTSGGLTIFNQYAAVKTILKGMEIYSLHVDSGAQLWVGTDRGLLAIGRSESDHELYFDPPAFDIPLNRNENAVVSLLSDSKDANLLWVGTQYGLKSFNKIEKTFARHPNPPKWHDNLPQYTQYETMDMDWFRDGIAIGGGASGGVLLYNSKNWQQYLYRGGVPEEPYFGNYVNAILPIGDSSILIGTSTMFGKVDFRSRELMELPIPELRNVKVVEDLLLAKNGLVWVVGKGGMARISLPDIASDFSPYQPIIREIQVNGKPVEFKNSEEVIIQNDRVNVFFRILSPNPLNRDSLVYRWQLAGHDNQWQSDMDNKVSYSGLMAGEYSFKFQCAEIGQNWISGEDLKMIIRAPFYRQRGYIILFVSAFIGLVFGLVRIISAPINKRIRQKSDLEKRTINAELSALRSQMNPHFIFNSLNSIYNFILDKDNDRAAEYLSKFASLMRMVLAHSQSKGVTLDSELTVLELYLELEQLRFDNKFEYTICKELIHSPNAIFIPPMLIQPYIENAIWHGFMHKKENGQLKLSILQKSTDYLHIIIEDNGIGREAARQFRPANRRSFGSKITEERIDSFSILYDAPFKVVTEDIKNDEGSVCGTRVILDIYTMKSAAS